MKIKLLSQFKFYLVSLSICALIFNANAEESMSDHRGGNGGGNIASEFTTIAKNISIIWEDICYSTATVESSYCGYLNDFKELLDVKSDHFVKVLSQADVTGYDGKARGAINNGVDEIIVNSLNWQNIQSFSNSTIKKVRLVLHEYASILRLDSSDFYGFSNELFSLFSRKKYDLTILSGEEILPKRCSIRVYGDQLNKSTYQAFSNILGKAHYLVIPRREKSRYFIKVYSTCSSETVSNTCGLFYQQVDTFKNRVVRAEMFVDNQILTGDDSILKSLMEKVSENLSSCY